MENGLLVLEVTGEELRALCDERLKAMSAAHERVITSLKKEIERSEKLRSLDPHSCRDIAGGADEMLEGIRRKVQHNVQEITFLRDHIALGKTHSVYWRDIRDLLFANDDYGLDTSPGYGGYGLPRRIIAP